MSSAPEPLDPSFQLSLPAFEGPLDLLLHLIRKHELDVLDLPIAFVTERYLAYVSMMERLNLDIASEYLVMAATLAHIKSKMLLPQEPEDQQDDDTPEEEVDPRAELIRRLLEYQKYKAAAEQLGSRGIAGRDVFVRGSDAPEASGPPPLVAPGLFKLLDAFQAVLKRAKADVAFEITAEGISIQDRMRQLTELLRERRQVVFEDLFEGQVTVYDLVVTFMAILEMGKRRLVRIYQADPHSPIHLRSTVVSEDAEDDPGDDWRPEHASYEGEPSAEAERPAVTVDGGMRDGGAVDASEDGEAEPSDEPEWFEGEAMTWAEEPLAEPFIDASEDAAPEPTAVAEPASFEATTTWAEEPLAEEPLAEPSIDASEDADAEPAVAEPASFEATTWADASQDAEAAVAEPEPESVVSVEVEAVPWAEEPLSESEPFIDASEDAAAEPVSVEVEEPPAEAEPSDEPEEPLAKRSGDAVAEPESVASVEGEAMTWTEAPLAEPSGDASADAPESFEAEPLMSAEEQQPSVDVSEEPEAQPAVAEPMSVEVEEPPSEAEPSEAEPSDEPASFEGEAMTWAEEPLAEPSGVSVGAPEPLEAEPLMSAEEPSVDVSEEPEAQPAVAESESVAAPLAEPSGDVSMDGAEPHEVEPLMSAEERQPSVDVSEEPEAEPAVAVSESVASVEGEAITWAEEPLAEAEPEAVEPASFEGAEAPLAEPEPSIDPSEDVPEWAGSLEAERVMWGEAPQTEPEPTVDARALATVVEHEAEEPLAQSERVEAPAAAVVAPVTIEDEPVMCAEAERVSEADWSAGEPPADAETKPAPFEEAPFEEVAAAPIIEPEPLATLEDGESLAGTVAAAEPGDDSADQQGLPGSGELHARPTGAAPAPEVPDESEPQDPAEGLDLAGGSGMHVGPDDEEPPR